MQTTTPRLVLREFEESDWQAAMDYEADPELLHYKGAGPATEQAVRERIHRAIDQAESPSRSLYEFAIILRGEDTLIGRCNLTLVDLSHKEAEIGYALARNYWGNSYAIETASVLLKLGFEELALHRIFSYCAVENRASYRIMERIGMRREGVFREHKWFKGRWWDFSYYASGPRMARAG